MELTTSTIALIAFILNHTDLNWNRTGLRISDDDAVMDVIEFLSKEMYEERLSYLKEQDKGENE